MVPPWQYYPKCEGGGGGGDGGGWQQQACTSRVVSNLYKGHVRCDANVS